MLFKEPPSIGQFAIKGIWEHPLSFKVDDPPSIDEVRKFLKNGKELAFEVFFGSSFFGIRFEGSPTSILELSEHCLISMHKTQDFNSFLKALEEHPTFKGLCQEVSHVEMGAINAWKSVGSFDLPLPTEALAQMDDLWLELNKTPLMHNTQYPKAVEIAYSSPFSHWLGFPISAQEPPYAISKKMLREVLLKFSH